VRRNFPGLKVVTAFCFFLIQYSCTKIDSTSLGGDLIPAVDNVNTFDTTLTIEATQGLFYDTSRIYYSDYHLLGSITNDPLFGKTSAGIYLELKPASFPYKFGATLDTIDPVDDPRTGFDSAVLCLSVKGFYGDSTKAQRISVHLMNNGTTNFRNDSAYRISYKPNVDVVEPSIGSLTVVPVDLKNKLYLNTSKKDSVTYQLRIKLSDDFLYNTLLSDTSAKGLYRSDSLFKTIIKGFAVLSEDMSGSNGLFYTDFTDAATRLEVHYRKRSLNKIDTTFSSFFFSYNAFGTTSFSAQANNITRDSLSTSPEYPKSQQPGALYLQSVPGTFASLNIPALSTFGNRIIHRAEIIAEQIPGDITYDSVFTTPQFLYLDLKDTAGSATTYKPIYYDLNTSVFYDPDNSSFVFPSSSGINFGYFGGYRRFKKDAFGNTISYYNFNVSRYVQNLVTKNWHNYEMRLYAPYLLNYFTRTIPFPGGRMQLANGRIKIGDGTNENYKLRMRIVYSKI
jgi:hypothetical protein